MPIVEVSQLWVRYRVAPVLEDLNFQIKKGEYVGIVGPNGSGKTTLLKAILDLIPNAAGVIRLFDTDLSKFSQWQNIGYLPQKSEVNSSHFPVNVWEVVSLGLLSKKKFPKRIHKNDIACIEQALQLMEIENLKGKMFMELSGGQQQRVLLARAIVNDPELIILDEPSVALDPQSRESFYRILQNLHQNRHKTIIMVSHDIATIGKYVSKMMYIDRKIIFFGTQKEFCQSKPMSEYFGPYAQHIICHLHDNQ
jgi:zinc transport system ATP-binding protein